MQIAKINKIKVILNDFFLLLILAYGLLGILPQAILIFLLVLWHETAHILAALNLGKKVEAIELYPFGGVARMKSFIELRPNEEMKIALAGPLSNILLIFLGMIAAKYYDFKPSHFEFFIRANLVMALFNLLPALPLDGGRIWRSFWAKKVGFKKATFSTIALSQYIAGIMFFVGIAGLWLKITDINLLVIAIFLFFSSRKDQDLLELTYWRYLLKKKEELIRLGVMEIREIGVTKKTTIRAALPLLTSGKYHRITVIDEAGEICSSFSEEVLLKNLFEQGLDCTIAEILQA